LLSQQLTVRLLRTVGRCHEISDDRDFYGRLGGTI
jgi:hypothetical protein